MIWSMLQNVFHEMTSFKLQNVMRLNECKWKRKSGGCALVPELKGGGNHLVWSAENGSLLVTRVHHNLSSDVHILDVAPLMATGMEPGS